MILVNHNARNENKSAIKIYASFSVLFFFFFFTNSTNSIAHYNKESRFSAFKNGTNSSVGWVEGHHISDTSGAFRQLKVETFNIFPASQINILILPKIITFLLSLNDIRLTNRGVCASQNKGEHIISPNIKI